jgi:hypothetical protein
MSIRKGKLFIRCFVLKVKRNLEILSDLTLQLSLHYNLHLAPFLIICQISCLYLKVMWNHPDKTTSKFQYDTLHPTYRVILLAIHLILIVVQIVRPMLGYYGNLSEKVLK